MRKSREEIDALIDAHRDGVRVAHAMLYTLARMIMAGTTPIMIGPSGCGKSVLASTVAEMMDLPFRYARAVRDEFALVGFRNAHGEVVRTAFREAFEHGGVFLMDEMDAGDPRALLAFNEAFANGRCDFPDGVVEAHPDFHVVAAANTYGTGRDRQYVGRVQLDATTLDRFVPLDVDYDRALEQSIPDVHQAWRQRTWDARDAVAQLGLRHIVSTRAIVQGSELLRAGFDVDFVEKAVLMRGLPEDQCTRLENAIDAIADERENGERRREQERHMDEQRQLARIEQLRRESERQRLEREEQQRRDDAREQRVRERRDELKNLDSFPRTNREFP